MRMGLNSGVPQTNDGERAVNKVEPGLVGDGLKDGGGAGHLEGDREGQSGGLRRGDEGVSGGSALDGFAVEGQVNGEDGRDGCPGLSGNRAVEIGVVNAGRGDHDFRGARLVAQGGAHGDRRGGEGQRGGRDSILGGAEGRRGGRSAVGRSYNVGIGGTGRTGRSSGASRTSGTSGTGGTGGGDSPRKWISLPCVRVRGCTLNFQKPGELGVSRAHLENVMVGFIFPWYGLLFTCLSFIQTMIFLVE